MEPNVCETSNLINNTVHSLVSPIFTYPAHLFLHPTPSSWLAACFVFLKCSVQMQRGGSVSPNLVCARDRIWGSNPRGIKLLEQKPFAIPTGD